MAAIAPQSLAVDEYLHSHSDLPGSEACGLRLPRLAAPGQRRQQQLHSHTKDNDSCYCRPFDRDCSASCGWCCPVPVQEEGLLPDAILLGHFGGYLYVKYIYRC